MHNDAKNLHRITGFCQTFIVISIFLQITESVTQIYRWGRGGSLRVFSKLSGFSLIAIEVVINLRPVATIQSVWMT